MKRAFAAVLLVAFSSVAAQGASPRLSRFEFQQPQMGLPFRIVLYAGSEQEAKADADAAFARIAELNSILSDYEDESELMRLSKSSGEGKPVVVSADLWNVLSQSQALSQRTEGAFDVTVGPLVQLWRRARRQRAYPDSERIAEALSRTGYRHLQLDKTARTAWLKIPGMRLDAGAIAKGYAVDEALQILAKRGVRSALVAGGGDLAVSGPPPNESGWKIDIAALATNSPPGHVLLVQAGLATSGDIFQHVLLNGQRYSHIVDPRTGVALTNSSLVTVIGTNCATADSLATAVSVLGPSRGLALIEQTPQTVVRISYHGDGTNVVTVTSKDWKRMVGASSGGERNH